MCNLGVLLQQPARTRQVKEGLRSDMLPGMMPEHSTVHVLSAHVTCLATTPHMGRLQMLLVSGWLWSCTAALACSSDYGLIHACSVQQPICVGLLLATCQTARRFSGLADCAAAGMIFRKEPFFYGHDNYDQLVKIAKVSCLPCPAAVAGGVV